MWRSCPNYLNLHQITWLPNADEIYNGYADEIYNGYADEIYNGYPDEIYNGMLARYTKRFCLTEHSV